MEWSKYPLEKLFYFVAGTVPGFTALLIYHLARPGSFRWFFLLGFLGYRTKIGVIVIVAFLIGNSLNEFLSGLFGALGGAIGAAIGFKPSSQHDVAPWRDPQWRAALARVLGDKVPNDTLPMQESVYDLKVQRLQSLLEPQHANALIELHHERWQADIDDSNWGRWYDHYHAIVRQPDDHDVALHIQKGLAFNMETTAMYILISAYFVPALRHWWCILPASLWTAILVNQSFWEVWRTLYKWSTLNQQITYLTNLVVPNK